VPPPTREKAPRCPTPHPTPWCTRVDSEPRQLSTRVDSEPRQLSTRVDSEPRQLSAGRAGLLIAAVVLDVTSPRFDQLHLKLEGDNAMLPNLDLVNVATFTSKWCVHRACARGRASGPGGLTLEEGAP
jgi:hypothetical protein